MQLHFYTTYDNVQILKEGDEITVWTKAIAKPFDIHISLNTKEYAFHKIEEGVFEVNRTFRKKEE